MTRRTRAILISLATLVVAGTVVWVGFGFTHPATQTAGQLAAFVNSVDFSRMTGIERSEALRKLEERVNLLTIEERRKWWAGGQWHKWFDVMSDNEKGHYIDATLPTGFKQVLGEFENLSDDRRARAIDVAMQQLKHTHRLVTDHEPGHAESMYGTSAPPVLSAELENRARMVGFKTFFTESSAQTKAQLAPLLEELQNQLEVNRHVGQ